MIGWLRRTTGCSWRASRRHGARRRPERASVRERRSWPPRNRPGIRRGGLFLRTKEPHGDEPAGNGDGGVVELLSEAH